MNTKNNFKFSILCVMLCLSLIFSCSDKNNDPKPQKTRKITLSVDKNTFQADGKEVVNFTVYDDLGKDVTEKCDFYVNQKIHNGNKFSTNEPGSYKILAQLKNSELRSNLETIVAIDNNSTELLENATIVADKTRLLADNTDLVVLKVLTKEGADITSSVTFYVNGKALEGRYMKAEKQSIYKISATIGGKELKNKLQISAFNNVTFKHRALIEEFTGTWCQYCHLMIKFLDPIVKNNEDIISIKMHMRDKFSGNFQATVSNRLADAYSVEGYPSIIINRSSKVWSADITQKGESYIKTYIKKESEAGLAIENSVKDDMIEATVYLRVNKNMKGKVAVALTESKLEGNQINMGNIEHEDVMRNYLPDVLGSELLTLEAGKTQSFPIKIPIKGSAVKNINNCHLVAVLFSESGEVVNVQETPIGMNIGY